MEEDQLEFEFSQDEETGEITRNEEYVVEFDYDDVSDDGYDHYENLAEMLDQEVLEDIGRKVIDSYEYDLSSREEWERMTIEAIENLGLIMDSGAEPFEGACMATHPLILENVVKYQSKASNELLPASGPCRTKIIGIATPELEDSAFRVKTDMNYTVQEVMEEYYSETEKALFFTGLIGNGFKRKYYDPIKRRNSDEMCFPDKLVVNNMAKSLQTAKRISYEFYKSEEEVEQYMGEGHYIDVDLGSPEPVQETDFGKLIREIQGITSESKSYDDVYQFVEQHCYLKLFDDEYAKPYIVTVEKTSKQVVKICRNWAEYDPTATKLEWFTHYTFVPTAGFYALGYAQLLGNLQKTLTVSMRALVDAGQLANMQGGFKNSNARVIGDNGPISPGEFKDIEVPSLVTKIEDVFFPLPFKEPSTVLFNLMEFIQASGQKFADSTEQVIADSTNYGPVGTTMALLEASTKFFAAVYKRMYTAQASELKIIARLNKDYGESFYAWAAGEFQQMRKEDYSNTYFKILPVADPNYSSQAQRLAKVQAMLDTALKSPQHHDMRSVLVEFHKALGNEDVDRFLPKPEEPQKLGPLEDIQAVLQGKPIKAFPEQDHESHIVVKSMWLQAPDGGGSEIFSQFAPAIMANIQEHAFQQYVAQIQALQGEGFSVAQAAQRLNRLNQIAEEEEQQGSPASQIAKAEMLKATADMMKEQREAKNDQIKHGLEFLRQANAMEKEANRAVERDREIDLKEEKMAIDLITKGIEKASKE